jgi:hypothetical protein
MISILTSAISKMSLAFSAANETAKRAAQLLVKLKRNADGDVKEEPANDSARLGT